MNRKIIGITLWVGMTAILSACNRPQMIPEETLQVIIREELISQAVALYSIDPAMKPADSLDLHTAVLEKHGYRLSDFEYTIRKMSLRKSNPLGTILEQVAGDIERVSLAANERYRTKLLIDSISVARTADTVYRSDTVLHSKLGGFRLAYGERGFLGDSSVRMGNYRLQFDYSTGTHAQAYTKSVHFKQTAKEPIFGEGVLWLLPTADTISFHGEVNVNQSIRRIDISFQETLRKDTPVDTSYLANLKIVRLLPVREARAELQYRLTGLKPLSDLYYDRYIDSLQKFGGPLPPLTGR